jgi:hypothetical protein
MELHEAEVDRKVIYYPVGGLTEEGIIISKNSIYVFVRYGNDFNSKATHPRYLEYITE